MAVSATMSACGITSLGRSKTTTTSAPAAAPVANPAASTSTAPSAADIHAYEGAGPYSVGVLTVTVGDRPLTVWYPSVLGNERGRTKAAYDLRDSLPDYERAKLADTDGSVFVTDAYDGLPGARAKGPFPLVLFSHEAFGLRTQSSYLTTAMASWGFVVAAPEHLSRDFATAIVGDARPTPADVDDLVATLNLMLAESDRADSPFGGLVDPKRIVAVGQGEGATAAFRVANDPRVVAYVAMSGGGCYGPGCFIPQKPSLLIAGQADAVVPLDTMRAVEDQLPLPRRFVSLAGVTRVGLTDLCLLARDRGGFVAAAASKGVRVPEPMLREYVDGCNQTATRAEVVWPAVRHITIAYLRAVLGVDTAPAGLGPALATYPTMAIDYQESLT